MGRALSRSGLRPPERFYLSFPHELSGGQRQRVVIAGALALDPDVIVADEPVSNLDASVRGEILQLLMQLRKDLGLSIIIVTHDLGLAWTVADRIAVMYLGRLVELGPIEDVLLHPLHPYTRALLDVVPEAGGINRPILEGEAPDPTQHPEGVPVPPALPRGRQRSRGRARHPGEVHRRRPDDRGARPRSRSGMLGGQDGREAARERHRRLRRLTRIRSNGSIGGGCGGDRTSSPSSPPFSTPRIASISESPTGASRRASRPRTDASNVLRLASAISALASSSRTLAPRTSARCSAPTRASREARASSRAARRLARSVAASRPSSTRRSTAARPTSEYIGVEDREGPGERPRETSSRELSAAFAPALPARRPRRDGRPAAGTNPRRPRAACERSGP